MMSKKRPLLVFLAEVQAELESSGNSVALELLQRVREEAEKEWVVLSFRVEQPLRDKPLEPGENRIWREYERAGALKGELLVRVKQVDYQLAIDSMHMNMLPSKEVQS